jgi:transposase
VIEIEHEEDQEMSLTLEVGRSVPEETRRVAKAAFPKGNVYLWIGDELGELYSDHLFIDLYPVRGQPTISSGRLALITILQFMEGLTDRQAAEAVRDALTGNMRWDWN